MEQNFKTLESRVQAIQEDMSRQNVEREAKPKPSISLTSIIAIGTILISGMGSWALASSKVATIDQREQDHYVELEKQVAQMDSKLDFLIGARASVVPTK